MVSCFYIFLKKKKLNYSNKKKQKISINLKLNLRIIKSILYKNKNVIVLWVRFIAELFFLNKISYLLEIVLFLFKKNTILFNTNLTKKIFTILELIAGNSNFKNSCIIKMDKIKDFCYFMNINSNKTPGKVEKLISIIKFDKILNITNFKIFNSFFKFGLIDLYRKVIQKTVIFSHGDLHLMFLKYWFNTEIFCNSKGIIFLLFLSFIKRKKNIKDENIRLITKNLHTRHWDYYLEYLKIFLQVYYDLNLLKINLKILMNSY